jgi:hypothetical protein
MFEMEDGKSEEARQTIKRDFLWFLICFEKNQVKVVMIFRFLT